MQVVKIKLCRDCSQDTNTNYTYCIESLSSMKLYVSWQRTKNNELRAHVSGLKGNSHTPRRNIGKIEIALFSVFSLEVDEKKRHSRL